MSTSRKVVNCCVLDLLPQKCWLVIGICEELQNKIQLDLYFKSGIKQERYGTLIIELLSCWKVEFLTF